MTFDNYSIRLLGLQDVKEFYTMVEKNRARLEDFFTGTVSRTKTLEDTKNFIEDNLQKAKAKTYFPYVIIDNSSVKIIGFLDLKNIDWSIPKSEMGCYIDEDYAGKGITTKAFSLFCDYCFDKFAFKKLYLRTHQQNVAARRVAEACGFELEGTLRKEYKTTAGEVVDLMYYGRLN